MNSSRLVHFLALALLLCTAETQARNVPLSAEQIIDQSDRLVIGRVVHLQAQRLGPGRPIATLVRIHPETTLKGPFSSEDLEIWTAGGVLPQENLASWTSHQASFRVDERVLVALEPSPYQDGRWCVLGRASGKFQLADHQKLNANESSLDFVKRVAPQTAETASITAQALVPFDFLSVMTHEQGHFTGLADLYNSASEGGTVYQACMGAGNNGKTMYGLINPSEIAARDLAPSDILGQEWIYGLLRLPISNGPGNASLFAYFCSSAQTSIQCSSVACTPKVHWATLPVPYRIHTADFLPEHIPLIQQGFATWEAIRSSAFAVRYDGDTSIDVISSDDRIPVMRVANASSADDRMTVGSALAVTTLTWLVNSGNMNDADITFNHTIEFAPAIPRQATATPTPQPDRSGGGGCGTVGVPPIPPSGNFGGFLLLGLVAFALTRRPQRSTLS